ncbi:hypothetical protein [Aliikangiella marina]|uniref:hypothetical protein n=1 Tax=Aliikangiella marina TaxID=1712262 RepID=UPI00163DD7B6|nr:hypothetical protein [Aliikangiella marina]
MPVFINEVNAEVPQAVVPEVQSQPKEERTSVSQPEYEFLKTLNIIEERRERLEFD